MTKFEPLAGGRQFQVGDRVTFSQPRPKLWRRLLIWLKLVKPKPPPVYVVTSIEATEVAVWKVEDNG